MNHWLSLIAAVSAYLIPAHGGAVEPRLELSGGSLTAFNRSAKAFELPAPHLDFQQLRSFTFGNRLFNTNWTIAPGSVKSFDGLGPLYNRVSCAGCHIKDGRGRPPKDENEPMLSMLVRLSIPGTGEHGEPIPEPGYGSQLNDRAIPGIDPEGGVVIRYTETKVSFADGETIRLRRPQLEFRALNYGALQASTLTSARVAPAVFGSGLLDAVPDTLIRALADPEDSNSDGISGRINQVWDEEKQTPAIGRFGWKANMPTLRQQSAAALHGDIGITTSLHPDPNCSAAQTECRRAVNGGEPEFSDEFLEKLTTYISLLGVPARRDVDAPAVARGERFFRDAGCGACHVPKLETGAYPSLPRLANQIIFPYTDLLLHDMGEGLADERPDFEATGREWRTPPLWGIGLVETVNKHTNFLHDGRARDLLEAVIWHGGEAAASRDAVMTMSAGGRDALLAFLRSL